MRSVKVYSVARRRSYNGHYMIINRLGGLLALYLQKIPAEGLFVCSGISDFVQRKSVCFDMPCFAYINSDRLLKYMGISFICLIFKILYQSLRVLWDVDGNYILLSIFSLFLICQSVAYVSI